MDAPAETRRLGALLRAEIRDAGGTARDVATRLGYHRAYLSRVLSDRQPLKVRHCFGILQIIGRTPDAFFRRHYPLAGPLELPPVVAAVPLDAPGEPSAADYFRYSLWRRGIGPASPEEWTARAARLLRFRIRAAGTNQRAVSRAMGLGPSALPQALQGASSLTTRHLFGVLAVLDLAPARFFAELLAPPVDARHPAAEWQGMFELATELLARVGDHVRSGEPIPEEALPGPPPDEEDAEGEESAKPNEGPSRDQPAGEEPGDQPTAEEPDPHPREEAPEPDPPGEDPASPRPPETT